MAEVLTGGRPDDDEPSPRRPVPRIVVVLAAVAVGLGALGYGALRDGGHAAPRGTAPAPVSPVTVRPSPPGAEAAREARAPSAPPSPSGPLRPQFVGPKQPGPAGLELLLGGAALRRLDAASGDLQPAGLPVPEGYAVERLVPVQGGVLVLLQQEAAPYLGRVLFLRSSGGAAELVRADDVVAAARPGRFWALRNPPAQGRPATLLEVTTGGRVLLRRPVPAGWLLHADTGAGLLVAAYRSEQPAVLALVDPASGQRLRTYGRTRSVVVATSRRAAWLTPACQVFVPSPEACFLVVSDLRTGGMQTYRWPGVSSLGVGAFSPDGRRLALASFGQHGFDRPAQYGRVWVLDLTTGRPVRLPGIGTPEKQAADLSWSPDGRYLAIGVRWPDDGFQRIGLWSTSTGRLTVLPGRFPGGYPPSALLVR